MRWRELLPMAGVGFVLVAVSGLAQRPAPGGMMPGMDGPPPFLFISQKSVQEELKLTEEQVKKIMEERKKYRDAREALQNAPAEEMDKKIQDLNREGEKAVASVLQLDQTKRLKQITLQQVGPLALGKPEYVKELSFSEEQQKKIKDIREEMAKEIAKAQKEKSGDPKEVRKKMGEVRHHASEQILKLLSDEQKAKWKEALGEPFKGELNFGGRGERPKAPPKP